MNVVIEPASLDFRNWDGLMALLLAAFAYQHNRVDPPSSVLRLDPDALAAKAREEQLFVARRADELVGCVFTRQQPDSLYVGKLAVQPSWQGQGIGRRLMQTVEDHATHLGCNVLELDVRIELSENQETFAALGFAKTSEQAHEGYNRITFITMQKRLD